MEPDHDVFDDTNIDTSPTGGPSTARWNPTKDQITMLESLYRQGVRTPSADQIQQITARLRAFGHIEGKNVFYWFQNHKARQRQKQKQESMAYLNRFHHRPSTGLPVYAPPPTPHCPNNNVMCGPYYVPQGGEMGYFQQYPKMILPSSSGLRRKPGTSIRPADQRLDRSRIYATIDHGSGYDAVRRGRDGMVGPQNQGHSISPQVNSLMSSDVTLPLFPLHPTGIVSGSTPENVYGVSEGTTTVSQYEQPYFDFFSGCSPSSG